MTKVKEYRKLPDGKVTQSTTLYLKKWKEIYQPLEVVYGLKLLGFDPGFLFCEKDHPSGTSISIPMWLAQTMLKVAADKRHDPA